MSNRTSCLGVTNDALSVGLAHVFAPAHGSAYAHILRGSNDPISKMKSLVIEDPHVIETAGFQELSMSGEHLELASAGASVFDCRLRAFVLSNALPSLRVLTCCSTD